MMASINPLGERARGNRWGRTAGAFTAAAVLGGWALGAAAGLLGSAIAAATAPVDRAAVLVAALVLAAGVAELARWPVPSRRRQVDEAWLGRYRGWVYGGGFGVQLGAGLVTTVTTTAVYALAGVTVVLGAAGQPGWAHAMGALFGLARAVPVLTSARLDDPARLRRRAARLERAAGASRLATGTSLCALGALALVLG
jgi:hypothetical protein